MGEESVTTKLAAGGVVLRRSNKGVLEVLVVHRPRYDDWSLPKGKLDEGESLEATAKREVEEETGLVCRIVRKLTVAEYMYVTTRGERPKEVHYYLMVPQAGKLREEKDDEIDSVVWLPVAEATDRLTYEFDQNLVRTTVDAEQASGSI